MINTDDVRDAVWNSLREYSEKSWEDFYPEHESYRRAIQDVCASQFKTIVSAEWNRLVRRTKLTPCVAVLYVNSRILRTRIPCPCRPFLVTDSALTQFFADYKRIVLEGSPKTVLSRPNGHDEDHFLGLIGQRIIANASPLNVSVINSLQVTDVAGVPQLIPDSLQIPSDALQDGQFVPAAQANIHSWLQEILVTNDSFDTTDFLANWPRWGRLVGPPVQFVTWKKARKPDSERPDFPFYPDDFSWVSNDRWRAVHYLYFTENPPIGFGAGCSVMLLEQSSATALPPADAIAQFVESVQRHVSWGMGHTIARIEDTLGERRRSTPERGYSISYPATFVVQKSPVKSSMPLCAAIRKVAASHPNPHVREIYRSADVEFVLRALEYLVNADETLTTGYEEITLPMLHAVEQLWFYWKHLRDENLPRKTYEDAIAEVNRRVRDWRTRFERYLRNPERQPEEFAEAQLLQILRTALGAETDLSELPKYREHFVHSFHVFGLGLLFIAVLSARPNCLEIPSLGEARRVVQTWYLAAFWHDIAYSVEKMEDLSNRYLGSLRRMAPKGFEEAKEQLTMNPNFGALLAIQCYFRRLPDIDRDYLGPVVTEYFATAVVSDLSTACRKQLVKCAQHGVLSALVFLHESHSNKPEWQAMQGFGLDAKDIGAAALAIMLHHADAGWFTNESNGAKVFEKIRSRPWAGAGLFVNLLMLCDSIAQWGRNFEHANSAKCLLDELDIDMSGKTLSICLRYPDPKTKYKDVWYSSLSNPISRKTEGSALLEFKVFVGANSEDSNQRLKLTLKDGVA